MGAIGSSARVWQDRLSRRALLAAVAVGLTVRSLPALASAPTQGPKKRLSVEKVDSDTAFDKAYGGADPGGGLTAQLTTELVNSGDFLIEERPDLGAVQAEQQLGVTQAITAETAPPAGQLIGAQVLVRASITLFEPSTSNSGISIGFGGGALSQTQSAGKIGLDLRLIDTTTGQVIAATTIEQAVSAKALSATYAGASPTIIDPTTGVTTASPTTGPSLGVSNGSSSVIGDTTRQMIDQAVAFIRDKLASVGWAGDVTDADGGQVILDVGADGSAAVGDRFAISRVSRRITDPATGELLGVIEDKLGVVKVASVQPRFCIAAPETPFQAQRGDVARFIVS